MKCRLALAATLLLVVVDGRACGFPPHEQRQPVEELLDRAKVVVLAKATKEIRHSTSKATYTLEVVEPIRGSPPRVFQIVGFPSERAPEETTFGDHTSKKFWNDSWVGRAPMSTDCNLYPPFSTGGTYLVFLDTPYHVKGFERITDPRRDAWLRYVRDKAGR